MEIDSLFYQCRAFHDFFSFAVCYWAHCRLMVYFLYILICILLIKYILKSRKY
ncbi:hypothetical protein [Microvirus mar6]|uniref:Uncharacterized protein n=1 Tax=Microvirus mar6 TaxID=2851196 RepID=A0A8F5MIP5_9VIRU|nr:hypothetical protein [Microvirus mar6]